MRDLNALTSGPGGSAPRTDHELLAAALRAACGAARLYAVIDGAASRALAPRLEAEAPEQRCLFSGALRPAVALAAPRLARLEPEGALTRWLLQEGWGLGWGVYCVSDASLDDVWRHVRGLFQVRTERGERRFFRFFDPRVLQVYLPTCTDDELDAVFGPVTAFLAECESGRWVCSRWTRPRFTQTWAPAAGAGPLEALTAAFSGVSSARNLWDLAGGRPEDFPLGVSAPRRWSELLEVAGEQGLTAALARQARLLAPGAPHLAAPAGSSR